jgi:hypothetical protein
MSVLNVRDYGAQGNGVQDDAPAFQAALTALPTYGGIIYVPASSGSYRCASSITIPAGKGPILIEGEGKPEPYYNNTGAMGAAPSIIQFDATVSTGIDYSQVGSYQGFYMRNLAVRFPGGVGKKALRVGGQTGFWLEHVLIQNTLLTRQGTGIELDDGQIFGMVDVVVHGFDINYDLRRVNHQSTAYNCGAEWGRVGLRAGVSNPSIGFKWVGGFFTQNTEVGAEILDGGGIAFIATYFENNGEGTLSFRIGNDSTKTPERISVVESTFNGQGDANPETGVSTRADYAGQVIRGKGITIERNRYSNYDVGLLLNTATGTNLEGLVVFDNDASTDGATTDLTGTSGLNFIRLRSGKIGIGPVIPEFAVHMKRIGSTPARIAFDNADHVWLTGEDTSPANSWFVARHLSGTRAFEAVFDGTADYSRVTFLEMEEQAAPGAPGANRGRVFVRDNGGGKTQLCVRFPTGAVQVLATEP